ncbi:methyltransferase domain-containing protein [Microcoleus sp. LEGE 07076]|uniref:methyltransferase domain-containing protein n=1 Tax=Microcoleus sp. LEGE 07076 TaxID=915322 RepID=UPI0018813E1A|nr:methyltransferase domain-containing protein [Microcoleus sp. LEGE 07076]
MINKQFNASEQDKIAQYWSQRSLNAGRRWNWWSCRQVIRYLNRRVCGLELNGFSQGLCYRAKDILGSKKLDVGVSIGCGIGVKEMNLIRWGLVNRMVCFELSEERIRQAEEEAKKRSLSQFIEFRREDAFQSVGNSEKFDLVHWNNSLHHMPDTCFAIEWSKKKLKPGGLFMMDDYVGPNYIQFSDECLNLGSLIRKKLPKKYLLHPASSPENIHFLDTQCQRPELSKIIAKDPSEAIDSENILVGVKKVFPDAEIVHTGGVVYFAALPPLYANFDPEDEFDTGLLESLLLIDELYTSLHPGETLYATALAIK